MTGHVIHVHNYSIKWGTAEGGSTTVSEASTPHSNGVCVDRLLEERVARLRCMVSEGELSRLVGGAVHRLARLALRSGRGGTTHWLPWRLHDLLALAERAAERRLRRRDLSALKAAKEGNDNSDMADSIDVKEDSTANQLLDRYNHLLRGSKDNCTEDDEYIYENLEEQSDSPNIRSCKDILKDYSFSMLDAKLSSADLLLSDVDLRSVVSKESIKHTLEDSIKMTDNKTMPIQRPSYRKMPRCNGNSTCKGSSCDSKPIKKNKRMTFRNIQSKRKFKATSKLKVNTDFAKHMLRSQNTCTSESHERINQYVSVTSKKIWVNNENHRSTIAKPIPNGLIELCKLSEKHTVHFNNTITDHISIKGSGQITDRIESVLAVTEESLLINIVMEDMEETIALRRTIGTDVCDIMKFGVENLSSINDNDQISPTQSDTIILYDENEPSTSKGIRHINLDAQCGSDTAINVSLLSLVPDKMGDCTVDLKKDRNNFDFGTSTNNDNDITTTVPVNLKANGIIIKDSLKDLNEIYLNGLIDEVSEFVPITNTMDCIDCEPSVISVNKDTTNKSNCHGHETIVYSEFRSQGNAESIKLANDVMNNHSEQHCIDTKLLKPVSSCIKGDESSSELCDSTGSSSRSPFNIQNSSLTIGIVENMCSFPRQNTQNLTCGTVQMHSYKGFKTSEDVVYQGKWHPHITSKSTSRNNSQGMQIIKGTILSVESKDDMPKEKVTYKTYINKFESTKKGFKIFRRPQPQVLDKMVKLQKKKAPVLHKNLPKSINDNRKLTRVATTSLSSKFGQNNGQESKRNCCTKNFIKINKYCCKTKSQVKNIFNKTIASIEEESNTHGKPYELFDASKYKVTGKQTDLKTDLLKHTMEKISHLNYFVLRNEPDKNKADSSSLKHCLDTKNVKIKQIACSSASSSCSSINSIATVRANSPDAIKKPALHNINSSTSSNSTRFPQHISKKGSIITHNNHKKCVIDTRKSKLLKTDRNTLRSDTKKLLLKGSERTVVKVGCNAKSNNVFIAKFPKESIDQIDSGASSIHENVTLQCNDQVNSNIIVSKNEDQTGTFAEQSSHALYDNIIDMIESRINCAMKELAVKNEERKSAQLVATSNWSNSTITNSPRPSKSFSCDENVIIPDKNIGSSDSYACDENVITPDKNIGSSDSYACDENVITPDKNIGSSDSYEKYSMSNKSVPSLNKIPESVIANTDFDCCIPMNVCNTSISNCTSSVQGIYERKGQLSVQSPAGLFAVQAFSGYSMNDGRVAGDYDYVNIVDSETGSINGAATRQIASEELYVSRRSSDSFHSCHVNEESSVPNWLFQIIAEQNNDGEGSIAHMGEMPPVYGNDGDAAEAEAEAGVVAGAGAGAGDGCGVHSDYSHDSSGHGTSLSSSNTNVSSGPISEAPTIDPSTGQYELLRDSGSLTFQDVASTSHHHEDHDGLDSSISRIRIPRNPLSAQSDIDADISSLDTDVPDNYDS